MRFLIKIVVTALIVAGVSELAKRFSWIAAIIASLPLTSILALSWLYWDTGDEEQVVDLSYGILWAILPSILFFIALPLFMKAGLRFPLATVAASLVMFLGYSVYLLALRRFGVTVI